ncbi:MAG: cob(I)yrinic acid a,c-diamide adenosyltransferase [Oscillospiraceae bacterium]
MEKGYVHVYTGDGKGKTTAAVGLATRAAGNGLAVGFLQFLKSGFTGEMVPLARMGVTYLAPQFSSKFVYQMTEEEKEACAITQQDLLSRAAELAQRLDVLVLDEVICAVDTGMITEADLLDLIKNRPAGLELVLTGRGATPAMLEQADYATEMKCIKHPYDKGVKARTGIEL